MAVSSKRLDQSSSYVLGPTPEECDMVMKGGITSGVVYPRAVCHLATTKRLRRLGGSSAGAIAATVAAAAERGRSSETGGFVALNALPDELGTSLSGMFQASPPTRPALHLLKTWIDPELGTPARVGRTIRVLLGGVAVLVGLLVTGAVLLSVAATVALFGSEPGPTARDLLGWLPVALLVGVVAALIAGAVRLARRTLRALDENGFGLCDGHTHDPSVDGPPLTDWMADTLDRMAAIPTSAERPAGRPLTFGDLWGEAASAAYREKMGDDFVGEGTALTLLERRDLARMRDVDVVVMTTDLSHGRPYRFPFSTQVFHWCPTCFEKYFPTRVVEHLRATGRETIADDDPDDGGRPVRRVCPLHPGTRLWNLPLAVDIPVVIAARLSLSFPALISAVPFHAVDFATVTGHKAVKTVWFSDGGIGSNFPIHFFDQLLPTRPTFGINLTPVRPDSDDLVWRPRDAGASGGLPAYRPITSMFGLVGAIADTMQNWVDNMQITTPGFNKRVANLRQRENEGGLNLEMPSAVIEELANRGAEAAALFDDFQLADHMEKRYRIAMAGLDEVLGSMAAPYPTYRAQLEDEVTAKLLATSDQVIDLSASWGVAGHPAQRLAPKPQPELRLMPRQ